MLSDVTLIHTPTLSVCPVPGCSLLSAGRTASTTPRGRHLPPEGSLRAGSVAVVFLAGVPLTPSLLLELADLLEDEQLAAQLRDALERRVIAFALQTEEAEAILSVLDDPPPGLEELRAVLLREIEPRRAEGR